MSSWRNFAGPFGSRGHHDSAMSILRSSSADCKPSQIQQPSCSMPVRQTPNRHLITSILAGGLFLAAPGSGMFGSAVASAAGFGCGCEVIDADCGCDSDGCDSGCKRRSCIDLKETLIFRALDSFAGGIEKVLHLNKCHSGCDAAVCDDGCDSAMMSEMVVPMPAEMHTYAAPMHTYQEPSIAPPQPAPPMESAPHLENQWHQTPPVVAPKTQMRMSEPRMSPHSTPMESRATQPRNVQPRMPQSRSAVPTPVPAEAPNRPAVPAPAAPDDEGGSLFDALSNPFSDDEVRVRRYEPVRPSSFQSGDSSSQTRRNVSQSGQTSSRRVLSNR